MNSADKNVAAPRRGFQLRRLRIASATSSSELIFKPGGNVVAGSSNTGKSFALQCIQFALGATKSPKPIPHAALYDRVFLTIEATDGVRLTLERSLRGGDVVAHDGDIGDYESNISEPSSSRVLGTHAKSREEESLSMYLLEMCGLAGKKILTAKNKIGNLTFRDVRRLFLIDEQRILTDSSPVMTENYSSNTREKSVFDLLITGVDDSSVVIAGSTKKDIEGRDREINRIEIVLRELHTYLPKSLSLGDARGILDKLNNAIENATLEQSSVDARIAEIEDQRRLLREKKNRAAVKVDSISNLLARFELLDSKYINDLSRLGGLREAASLLDFEELRACPICGASLSKGGEDHAGHLEVATDFLKGVSIEREKTIAQIGDLRSTMEGLAQDMAQNQRFISNFDAEIASLGRSAEQLSTPRIREVAATLSEMAERRESARTQVANLERIESLGKELSRLTSQQFEAPLTIQRNDSQAKEKFSLEVEALLRRWKYPDLKRVVFDTEANDLVISGVPRSSHGKGYRAVTYAGFTMALLDLANDESLPTLGFAILDSPLTTFKDRDIGPREDVSEDVKKAFFQDLASRGPESQVIIFENDEPPAELIGKMNYQHFSGRAGVGRVGFI